MSRVGGKIRVGRVTPIQHFFFLALPTSSLLFLFVQWSDLAVLKSSGTVLVVMERLTIIKG